VYYCVGGFEVVEYGVDCVVVGYVVFGVGLGGDVEW